MEFKIKDKVIGLGNPVFFIAEAGVNHNGSLELGKKLIDIAVESGADAVKFQTFKAEELNTKNSPKSTYHIETTGNDKHQSWYDLLKSQEISEKMHIELIDYCLKKEIIFLSTPYGEKSADLLEDLKVPAFKIASTDTNNIPFLKYVAKKNLPMILSSAMCEMSEVTEAVETLKEEGLNQIVMMQCTGNYPLKLENSNLNVISVYKSRLNCVIGYSDHTLEFINPVAATAIGAKVYEKHFTLKRDLPGPDHRMSLEPNELKKTVKLIRDTEKALGSNIKEVIDEEKENRIKLRKSIVSVVNIPKGDIIQKEMLAIKRPGSGLPPKMLNDTIGRVVKNNIKKDSILMEEDLK